jgi:sugar phosphate isomerase/epimerase
MGHLTLGHLTIGVGPLETIDVAAAAGFPSVSIRIAGRRKSDEFPQILGNASALREIRQRIDDSGLRLSSIMPHQFYEEVTRGDIAKTVDAALELRPDFVLCNDYVPNDGILEMVGPLAEAVADANIRIAIEFTKYSETRSLTHTLERIRQSGKPNLQVVIDALHLDRSGGTNAEVAATPREKIAFAQLCDAKRRTDNPSSQMLMEEARTARLEPGEGDIDLYGFLDALPRDVEIEYELPNPRNHDLSPLQRAERAYATFRSFLDGYAASRGFTYDWGRSR